MVTVLRNFLFDRMAPFREKAESEFRGFQEIFRRSLSSDSGEKAVSTLFDTITLSNLRGKAKLTEFKETFKKALENRNLDTSRVDEFFIVDVENEKHLNMVNRANLTDRMSLLIKLYLLIDSSHNVNIGKFLSFLCQFSNKGIKALSDIQLLNLLFFIEDSPFSLNLKEIILDEIHKTGKYSSNEIMLFKDIHSHLFLILEESKKQHSLPMLALASMILIGQHEWKNNTKPKALILMTKEIQEQFFVFSDKHQLLTSLNKTHNICVKSLDSLEGIYSRHTALEFLSIYDKLHLLLEENYELNTLYWMKTCGQCKWKDDDKRPKALVLQTIHIATPGKSSFRFPASCFMRLSKTHNIWVRFIESIETISKAIDEAQSQLPPSENIDYIILHGHGAKKRIHLKEDNTLSTKTPLSNTAIQRLRENTTIILFSCSNGIGKSKEHNISNHIAKHMPKNTKLFAPIGKISEFFMHNREIIFTNNIEDMHTKYRVETYKPEIPQTQEKRVINESNQANIHLEDFIKSAIITIALSVIWNIYISFYTINNSRL